MLTHILALIVGFGSLAIYMAAFFFPEVHRKNDFIWSGVGFFYALALWVFAPRIGGWFFLGQSASVALLVWFGLQTFSLRRQVTPTTQQTPVPSVEELKTKISLQERLGGLVSTVSSILPGKKEQVSEVQTTTPPTSRTSTTEEDSAATIGKSLVDAIDEDGETQSSTEDETPVSDTSANTVDDIEPTATTETTTEADVSETLTVEAVESTPENVEQEEKTTPPPEENTSETEAANPPDTQPEKNLPKDTSQG